MGVSETAIFFFRDKYDMDCGNEDFLFPLSICVLHPSVLLYPCLDGKCSGFVAVCVFTNQPNSRLNVTEAVRPTDTITWQ